MSKYLTIKKCPNCKNEIKYVIPKTTNKLPCIKCGYEITADTLEDINHNENIMKLDSCILKIISDQNMVLFFRIIGMDKHIVKELLSTSKPDFTDIFDVIQGNIKCFLLHDSKDKLPIYYDVHYSHNGKKVFLSDEIGLSNSIRTLSSEIIRFVRIYDYDTYYKQYYFTYDPATYIFLMIAEGKINSVKDLLYNIYTINKDCQDEYHRLINKLDVVYSMLV